MEHQQRNCNLLPTNLQYLEVKTEQEAEEEEEAEVEAGAEAGVEEHNNINFNSSPTNHLHLLHHQLHSLLLLYYLLL
jgi:hypothetical protein